MASFSPDRQQYRSPQDKVVVLTGGANGIGAAAVNLFAESGALIAFGDLDETAGEKLASQYDPGRVKFLKIDVTKYEDNVALFRLALDGFGRVDHALSIAGIVEQGNIFDPALTIEDANKPPTTAIIDVNLFGPLYLTRVATAYLSHNKKPGEDKSITLFSSVSGFYDSPGLFAYSASKHGVLGLMRSLRTYLPPTFGIRINAVAPLATATNLFPEAVRKGFQAQGFPINTPEQVADVTVALIAGLYKPAAKEAVVLDQGNGEACNGLTIYVERGRAWEIEEGLLATRDQWLGKGPNERLMKAGEWLASGAAWTSDE